MSRLRNSLSWLGRARRRVSADDVFVLVGIGLVSAGAALERLSVGLIVAGLLVLAIAIGGERAR